MKETSPVSRSITVLAVASALAAFPTASASGAVSEEDGVIVAFEGTYINLADGWGEATACRSDDEGTRCYRTQQEMFDVEQLFANSGAVANAYCSGDLVLYRDANYGGNSLSLSYRSTVIPLGGYGFDNVTSSFKVGPCSSRFYDTASGTGPYPGDTSANSSSATMVSGWDNRISAVRIS